MQAPKPQVSTFANEGASPLWLGPDVGHKYRAGPPVCVPAIRRRSNRQCCRVHCRGRSISEAPQQLKETRTRSTQTVSTVGERRADARRTQAGASIRTAALPRSLLASYRRQGGGRIPPVLLRSCESSFQTLIPLHARKRSRGRRLSSSLQTIPGNVDYTDDARESESIDEASETPQRDESAEWPAKGEQAILVAP